MPDDMPFIPHDEILRYEEILRLCKILAQLGIKTVRVTGGEPLMRKDCVELLRGLKATPGIENIALTTNAVILKPHVQDLVDIGLRSLNISLDTLCPEGFKSLTGADKFDDVWDAIEEAAKAGLNIKINCVPIKNVNEDQIIPIANIAKDYNVNVRFIELMPSTVNSGIKGLSNEEVLEILKKEYNDLTTDGKTYGFGPARYYKSNGLKGSIGLISALSHNFCDNCNRLRLTSEGFLQFCLHHHQGFDLRTLLRSGATDEEIKMVAQQSIHSKPKKHFLHTETNLNHMSRIGG